MCPAFIISTCHAGAKFGMDAQLLDYGCFAVFYLSDFPIFFCANFLEVGALKYLFTC